MIDFHESYFSVLRGTKCLNASHISYLSDFIVQIES
jgi:hypothetical protein